MDSTKWSIAVVTAVFVVTIGSVSPAIGGSAFSIDVQPHIDTPARTVSFLGNSHSIDAVAQRDRGDELDVSVDGPREDYTLFLYNADKQAVYSKQATGNAQFSIDLSGQAPGTYALALYRRSIDEFETVYPVVVRGYDVTLTVPSEALEESSVDATVSVSKVAGSKSISSVEVAIVDGSEMVLVDALKRSDGTYRAIIPMDSLEPGEYRVFAAVRGAKESFGRNERLGISNQHEVKITAAETQSSNGSEETEASGSQTESQGQVPVSGGAAGNAPAESTELPPTDRSDQPFGSESRKAKRDTASNTQLGSNSSKFRSLTKRTAATGNGRGESIVRSPPSTHPGVITPRRQFTTTGSGEMISLNQLSLGLTLGVVAAVVALFVARHRRL